MFYLQCIIHVCPVVGRTFLEILSDLKTSRKEKNETLTSHLGEPSYLIITNEEL